jgi:hypothetical protein
MKRPSKEFVTIPSALTVVSDNPPSEENYVQESKMGKITTIPEVFLQNHASPSRLLTTRKSKKARI